VSSSISVGDAAADAIFWPRKTIDFEGQRLVTFQPGPTAQVDVSRDSKNLRDTIRSGSLIPSAIPWALPTAGIFRTVGVEIPDMAS